MKVFDEESRACAQASIVGHIVDIIAKTEDGGLWFVSATPRDVIMCEDIYKTTPTSVASFRVKPTGHTIPTRFPSDGRLVAATNTKTFMGYPISWFELCDSYLEADGVVNRDGTLGLPDHGGFALCFRMRDEKRSVAGWGK